MTGPSRGLMWGQRGGLWGKATSRAPHGYVHPNDSSGTRRNRPRQDRQPRQRDSTAEEDREERESTGSPRPGGIDVMMMVQVTTMKTMPKGHCHSYAWNPA